jgi:hypothetical protein
MAGKLAHCCGQLVPVPDYAYRPGPAFYGASVYFIFAHPPVKTGTACFAFSHVVFWVSQFFCSGRGYRKCAAHHKAVCFFLPPRCRKEGQVCKSHELKKRGQRFLKGIISGRFYKGTVSCIYRATSVTFSLPHLLHLT